VNLARRAFVSVLGLAALLATPVSAAPGDLVRTVRLKLSAGDLATGEAAVSEYKREHGVDAEYLGAVGLARARRGDAREDRSRLGRTSPRFGKRFRRRSPDSPSRSEPRSSPKAGCARRRDGRGAAIRFLESEFARAKDTELAFPDPEERQPPVAARQADSGTRRRRPRRGGSAAPGPTSRTAVLPFTFKGNGRQEFQTAWEL